MDLELSDEQTWLSESVDTLLARTPQARLWSELVGFGALDVGGEDGLGAVELCLLCRAMGAHLASVPYLGSAALRLALGPHDLEADSVSPALLERGRRWGSASIATDIEPGGVMRLRGQKAAVEHADAVDRLAVAATLDGGTTLALVPRAAAGVSTRAQPALDRTLPLHTVAFEDVELPAAAVLDPATGRAVLDRLMTIGALLAAAEAVGAAGRMLEDACTYAGERRQFGRPIGSFQALRHLLADMYVRHASAWSTVLYAAATLDDEAADAAQTASIAKAYVARAAREVAHGAMQVFGGIAFTAEHPAHGFLRRIVVREQQFGDAAHHERALGHALAARMSARVMAAA